jgi:hypothetical protein
LEFKNVVTEEKLANPEARAEVKKELKKQLQAR